ncbi:hypothetical protein GCM10023189_12840 [Nibrella saemangeumensis]|uniref:Uncharacterized protein n=1 Tax=Nibrella saemangeumensis TaxID=1084526 RepID=A0ABP8MKY9_9BACT
MESRDERYEPGEDENQGPLSALARTEQVDPEIGEAQVPRMSPNEMLRPTAQDLEVDKQETSADGTNTTLQNAKTVASGDADNAAGNPNYEDVTGAAS